MGSDERREDGAKDQYSEYHRWDQRRPFQTRPNGTKPAIYRYGLYLQNWFGLLASLSHNIPFRMPLGVLDTRIDEDVENVYQQIDDDKEKADHQNDALDYWIISAAN